MSAAVVVAADGVDAVADVDVDGLDVSDYDGGHG